MGQNTAFSLSAVREYLVLEKEGQPPEPQGLGCGRLSPATSHDVGRDTAAILSPRDADRQEEVEQFFVDMRPSNALDAPNPDWIDKLVGGDMADGLGFRA